MMSRLWRLLGWVLVVVCALFVTLALTAMATNPDSGNIWTTGAVAIFVTVVGACLAVILVQTRKRKDTHDRSGNDL